MNDHANRRVMCPLFIPHAGMLTYEELRDKLRSTRLMFSPIVTSTGLNTKNVLGLHSGMVIFVSPNLLLDCVPKLVCVSLDLEIPQVMVGRVWCPPDVRVLCNVCTRYLCVCMQCMLTRSAYACDVCP